MTTTGTDTSSNQAGLTGTTQRAAKQTPTKRTHTKDGPPASGPCHNEVRLTGRLAAEAEERELPSGDRIVTLRVVVARPPAAGRRRQAADGPKRATVDTIDVVCWTAATRRTALKLQPDETVEVEGALRRRFFGGPSGRQSRYEVEAAALRRASGGTAGGT